MNAINPTIRDILLPAYEPCRGFTQACTSMRWAPDQGHVPRGFLGATGELSEVRLVLVVAEPGDPHSRESHVARTAEEILQSTVRYSYVCFRDGKDQFHRNIRKILNMCFPDMDFDLQLRKTLITESVLCSAAYEGGAVPTRVSQECRRLHLEPQLRALPNAVIVALGSKAANRLRGIPGLVAASAAAPPGCNFSGAEESWRAAAAEVRARLLRS